MLITYFTTSFVCTTPVSDQPTDLRNIYHALVTPGSSIAGSCPATGHDIGNEFRADLDHHAPAASNPNSTCPNPNDLNNSLVCFFNKDVTPVIHTAVQDVVDALEKNILVSPQVFYKSAFVNTLVTFVTKQKTMSMAPT